jgi:hypothetical protein
MAPVRLQSRPLWVRDDGLLLSLEQLLESVNTDIGVGD